MFWEWKDYVGDQKKYKLKREVMAPIPMSDSTL